MHVSALKDNNNIYIKVSYCKSDLLIVQSTLQLVPGSLIACLHAGQVVVGNVDVYVCRMAAERQEPSACIQEAVQEGYC